MPRGIFKVDFRLPPPWARTCLTLFEKGRLDKLQPPLERYFEKHGFSNVSLRPAAENHCRFLFICPRGGFSVGCSTPTSLDSSRPNPKATVVLPAPLKVCTRNVVSKSGDYEAASESKQTDFQMFLCGRPLRTTADSCLFVPATGAQRKRNINIKFHLKSYIFLRKITFPFRGRGVGDG